MRPAYCRSELAREKPQDDTFIQAARIIVDELREQARSYTCQFAPPTPH